MRFVRFALALAVLVPCVPAHGVANGTAALPPGLDLLRRFERGFAKATSEIGVRNGFLMFFTPDALSPPDTAGARAWLLAGPPSIEYRPSDLAWEPLYGDIARSVDLGYLTGPSSFTDREGGKHTGVYFSIWERDSLGLWRVVLDVGTDTPGPAPEFVGAAFRAAPARKWRDTIADSLRGAAERARDLASLGAADREVLEAARSDLAAAYGRHLAPEGRLHRDGSQPITGATAVAALGKDLGGMRARPFRSGVSRAGDLGWTFGPGELTRGGATKSGSYTHVWKRDDAGRWRIVVAILSPQR